MKSSRAIAVILLLFFLLLPNTVLSQNIEVFNFIGKSMNSAVNNYGKPAHQDRSDPAMECVFYKTKTHQLVFVGNKQGIYQAEGSKYYGNKSSATKALDKIISSSINSGFVCDTVSVTEFNIEKKGVAADICLYENVGSQKFEVRVKARTH